MSDGYILNRLRIDARHVLDLAGHEGSIGHPGVKGRFREIFVGNLLLPWLPAAVTCGTGIIIDYLQQVGGAGQQDIVIFDPLLGPAVSASPDRAEAVYLFDSVLARIEVKSTLTKPDLDAFVRSSLAISRMRLAVTEEIQRDMDEGSRFVFGAFNLLLGLTSDVAKGRELDYLGESMRRAGIDPTSGVVSMLCIADRGFWPLGRRDDGTPAWKELAFTEPEDPLAYFTGFVSSSCFDQRASHQGWSPVGSGVGRYIDHPFRWA